MTEWKLDENLGDIYYAAVNGNAPLNGNLCPNCKDGILHIYTHIFRKDFKHAGGWIWCDKCHCYDHLRGPVPEWWADVEPLDIAPLDIPPEHLSTYAKEIDERNLATWEENFQKAAGLSYDESDYRENH